MHTNRTRVRVGVTALLLSLLVGCSLFSKIDWDTFGTCVENCLTKPQPESASQCAADCANVMPEKVKSVRMKKMGQVSPQ